MKVKARISKDDARLKKEELFLSFTKFVTLGVIIFMLIICPEIPFLKKVPNTWRWTIILFERTLLMA